MKVGDKINCVDDKDAIKTMIDLEANGIHTDFDKEDGTRLIITGVDE